MLNELFALSAVFGVFWPSVLSRIFDRIPGEFYNVSSNPLLNSSGAKLVAAVSAIAVVVTGGGFVIANNMMSGSKPQATESPEAKKEEAAAIGALGRLEPAGEVFKIAPPAGGLSSRVLKLIVREGEPVKVGQPIAVMDNHFALKATAAQAEAQVNEAKARFRQIASGVDDEINAQRSNTSSQVAVIQQAQAEGKSLQAAQQSAEAALKTAAADVKTREAELAQAKKETKDYQALYKEGGFSRLQKERSVLAEEVAVQKLAQSKQAFAQAQEFLTQQNAKFEQGSYSASQAIEKANESGFIKKGLEKRRPADLEYAKSQIAVAEMNLQKAMVDFENSVIKAPVAGKILKTYAKDGEAVGTNGILDLGITEQMYVVAEVDENSISKISTGNRAIIRSDAFQGELSGKVERIGAQVRKNAVTSSDPSDKQDVRVVEVKIRLDDSKPVQALTNLQVKVSIQP
jgi:HlyD family secretion protein